MKQEITKIPQSRRKVRLHINNGCKYIVFIKNFNSIHDFPNRIWNMNGGINFVNCLTEYGTEIWFKTEDIIAVEELI